MQVRRSCATEHNGRSGRGKSGVRAKFSQREECRTWAGVYCRRQGTPRPSVPGQAQISCCRESFHAAAGTGLGSTKLDLGSGEPFDDFHRSTALGAESKILPVSGGGRSLAGLRCRAEPVKAKWQKRAASPVGEQAEIANAYKALWKQMKQKAAQEFLCRNSQATFFVSMRGPSKEGNFSVLERDQAMVGNGHAMGVAAEIFENLLRPAEGRFAVNNPMIAEEIARR